MVEIAMRLEMVIKHGIPDGEAPGGVFSCPNSPGGRLSNRKLESATGLHFLCKTMLSLQNVEQIDNLTGPYRKLFLRGFLAIPGPIAHQTVSIPHNFYESLLGHLVARFSHSLHSNAFQVGSTLTRRTQTHAKSRCSKAVSASFHANGAQRLADQGSAATVADAQIPEESLKTPKRGQYDFGLVEGSQRGNPEALCPTA